MPLRVVILEDNAERLAAMVDALAELSADITLRCADNAPDMIAMLDLELPGAALVCLDHDLGATRLLADGRRFDPGVGRDVTRAIAARRPTCPVLIHSTNAIGAAGMRADLADAGWAVSAVVPYGDLEWVRAAWLPKAARALRMRREGRSGIL